MRCAAGLFIVSLRLISSAAVPAATVTFATNAVISKTNLAYDGEDIVISGATLCNSSFDIRPSEFPRSLRLTNGAVLTHSPCRVFATNRRKLHAAAGTALWQAAAQESDGARP